ncbi:TIGR03773 family transporter-associated surface protein [Streptomyces drozdowiczii]|uniref:TIGR03773 family transporter-associated surface protein n=1 Tax=Streptomyces drozdowiczii TaxID=202862 RepID=A0ABY6PLS6_9ACTN|nr:TIGR03773 family transporter-associated surface protein [Streptomyces drozdowiczii]MCX0247503.1 TIGR03773 family transporter-associated surface protein [Streptomyces drozdowiczii]UZK53109.1 TIGR03773 family transporter-associated surface protein [Streptomyces drozdowiczii]
MNSRLLRGSATVLAALLLSTASALPAPADSSPSPGAESDAAPETGRGHTVIGAGHLDIGPRFGGGGWTVQIRDDTVRPPVWRDTEDVVLQVRDTAKIEVPEDKTFAFLGKPGDKAWLLPQVQQDGVLWPGWNSQEPKVAAAVEREVTWKLTDVKGPGDFVLFLNGSFGTPTVLFDGRKKLPQETGIEVNTHVHGNWAFTAPGTYLLDVSMSARTKDGKSHDSKRTLRFSVGPQDPRKAFAAKAPATSTTARDGSALMGWGAAAGVAVAVIGGTLLWRRNRRPAPVPTAHQEGTEQ